MKDHPNDNAQLLTGIQFDGGVVGKALKGPMCTYEFSGGVNMWHSDVIGLVASTVAHEMGHNFGMEHDTEDCECPDDRCIMAPASRDGNWTGVAAVRKRERESFFLDGKHFWKPSNGRGR